MAASRAPGRAPLSPSGSSILIALVRPEGIAVADDKAFAERLAVLIAIAVPLAVPLVRIPELVVAFVLEAAALSRIEVKLPTLVEQTAIATVLSDMDIELSALEGRRDKTRALKQAMMQELLTGKTRLV